MPRSPISAVPTLETLRTRIRPFTLDDAAALFAIDKQEKVMKDVSWPAKKVKESYDYIAAGPLVQYENFGLGRMAIEDKQTGQVIGVTGLKFLSEFKEVDVAYRLLPEYWGKGLATEVTRKVIEDGFNRVGLRRIIGMAFPHNTASIKVLKKVGMQYEKNVLFWTRECVLYAINQS